MNAPSHLAGLVLIAFLLVAMAMPMRAGAEPLAVDASRAPRQPNTAGFVMGVSRNPDGRELTVNSQFLLRDGKPWLPVMGEFHFSRYAPEEWRDELLKMKAGGIDVAATYVFWIHHEEEKGVWDWSGSRNLRDFVKACQDVGMPVIVRCGPWCHGEVRNGGLPDWVLPLGRRLRSDDPEYVGYARGLYQQIARQLQGLLWKDGGPVVGIQLENEFRNPRHLMTLKGIAREAGLDTPLYTRTGWPALSGPLEFGQILPLHGAYAEGFWDRNVNPMPGNYWQAFMFRDERTDTAVATDILGQRNDRDEADTQQYPYLTCELGGGMMTSYHRRILIDPRDIESVALVKTGSGSNLPGYYMYHGGTNPQGKLSTLMEAQNTQLTNSNDMPIKTYDFQAPLGEYGQTRPHYHGLLKLHLFLRDFGSELAQMPARFPVVQPSGRADSATLRWSVRSDGASGYVFVSNYQRLLPMAEKAGVQFDVKLAQGNLLIPASPITVPANAYFLWPFNLDMAGAKLIYATAQPVCTVQDGDTRYYIFSQTTGVPSEFAFDSSSATVQSTTGKSADADGRIKITDVPTGRDAAIRLKTSGGQSIVIVLLDDPTSRMCWKGSVGGRERVLLSSADLLFDGGKLRMQASRASEFAVSMLPAPQSLTSVDENPITTRKDGVFTQFTVGDMEYQPVRGIREQTKQPGPAREIKTGAARMPEQPYDTDFEQAAEWTITLPAGVEPDRDLLLRINYVGDVARLYIGERFVGDNFYNGATFDVGLKRLGPDAYTKPLTLKILPLRKDAPIYIAKNAWPAIGNSGSIAKVSESSIIERHEVELEAK